jgi:predicted ATPase
VRSLYKPGRHHAVVSVAAADPGVDTLVTAACCLWFLGSPDHALAGAREAVALARQLGDPLSLAEALCYETIVHWLRQDVTAQRKRATETIALSEAQGFPLFVGVGRAYLAAARAAGGEPGAVADLLTGLGLVAETGLQAGAPTLFVLLGEAYLAAGQLDEARGVVETGLGVAAQTTQAFYDAELHRLHGQIALATGAPTEAEELFNRALDIARTQEAKSFELRAATCLAHLWRDQGKRADARDLLTPVYAWFTEGFDTADLKDAKALLGDLSG